VPGLPFVAAGAAARFVWEVSVGAFVKAQHSRERDASSFPATPPLLAQSTPAQQSPEPEGKAESVTVYSLFVSLDFVAESTVRWFVVREKHCWMAADSADMLKRTRC
jgi:hypothetical protein